MSDIAIFDFDGTITCRDTTRIMIRAAASRMPIRGMMYMMALMFSRTFFPRMHFQRHKDILLFSLLGRMSETEVEAVLAKYREQVEPLLRPDMLDRIKQYHASGVRILVITASPEFAVKQLFEGLQVSVIGAKYTSAGGESRPLGQAVVSCFGAQKVERFHDWMEQEDWRGKVEAAWSDSHTDLPLMRLASKRYWVGSIEAEAVFRSLDPEGTFIETADT